MKVTSLWDIMLRTTTESLFGNEWFNSLFGLAQSWHGIVLPPEFALWRNSFRSISSLTGSPSLLSWWFRGRSCPGSSYSRWTCLECRGAFKSEILTDQEMFWEMSNLEFLTLYTSFPLVQIEMFSLRLSVVHNQLLGLSYNKSVLKIKWHNMLLVHVVQSDTYCISIFNRTTSLFQK